MMKSMGMAGRKRAEDEFDWKLIAARTKHVYEDVLSSRANPKYYFISRYNSRGGLAGIVHGHCGSDGAV